MKTENKSWRWKGKTYSGTIVWPGNLSEALKLLGEKEVWAAFKIGYLEICRRQICGITPHRRKNHKIDLSDLPDSDREMISELISDLKDAQKALLAAVAAEKSAQLEEQQTAPTDSSETREEAPALVSENDSSFEADFAKYLASLDSLPQQHTETAPQQPETAVNPPQSSQKGLLSRLFG